MKIIFNKYLRFINNEILKFSHKSFVIFSVYDTVDWSICAVWCVVVNVDRSMGDETERKICCYSLFRLIDCLARPRIDIFVFVLRCEERGRQAVRANVAYCHLFRPMVERNDEEEILLHFDRGQNRLRYIRSELGYRKLQIN